MKKILTSILTIAVVAGVAFGASSAFFSDVETSQGNILQAGALDLKVDSTAHYAGMVCAEDDDGNLVWTDETPNDLTDNPRPELLGVDCVGTWAEADLNGTHKFFDIDDVKPGDEGELTISLHVHNNDAWGGFSMSPTENNENECTEPEEDVDNTCGQDEVGEDLGELADALEFFDIWMDEGQRPGFQCGNPDLNGDCSDVDPTEGDNIHQDYEHSVDFQTARKDDETRAFIKPAPSDNDCPTGDLGDGNTEYNDCHGYAEDGRLVASTTYYFGVAWQIDPDAGNEIQTDSLVGDFAFHALQHRNVGEAELATDSFFDVFSTD